MGLGSLTTKVLLGHQGQRGVSTVREKPMASARDPTRGDGDKAASWRGFGRGRREQMQFCFRTFTVPPVQPNSVNRPSGGTCVPAAGATQGSGPLRCSLNFPWACALPGFRLACAENTPSRSGTRQACATPASRARALGSRTHLPRGAGPRGTGLPPSPLRVCAQPSRHRPRTARGCEAATAPSSWRQPGEVGPVQEGPARRRARVSPSRVPESCSSKGNDGLLSAASGAGPKHRLKTGRAPGSAGRRTLLSTFPHSQEAQRPLHGLNSALGTDAAISTVQKRERRRGEKRPRESDFTV